jgi:virginiamycin B lyase
VQVSFREWEVLTPGARPHDPLATPDGALWYTGQMANILGRLDPSTGAIKEYPLKTPASGPHAWSTTRPATSVYGELRRLYR